MDAGDGTLRNKTKGLVDRNGPKARVDCEVPRVALQLGLVTRLLPQAARKATALVAAGHKQMEKVRIISDGNEASQFLADQRDKVPIAL